MGALGPDCHPCLLYKAMQNPVFLCTVSFTWLYARSTDSSTFWVLLICCLVLTSWLFLSLLHWSAAVIIDCRLAALSIGICGSRKSVSIKVQAPPTLLNQIGCFVQIQARYKLAKQKGNMSFNREICLHLNSAVKQMVCHSNVKYHTICNIMDWIMRVILPIVYTDANQFISQGMLHEFQRYRYAGLCANQQACN